MSEAVRHEVREIYCEVLFELAEERGVIDAIQNDIEKVRFVLEKEPDFAALLNSPTIKGAEKSESLRRVFTGFVSDLALDFISVLARRNRMAFLNGISDRYEDLVDRYHKRELVEVEVSRELAPEQIDKLKKQLEKAVDSEVKLSVKVNKDLIGGIVIKKDDIQVDNSIRTTLTRVARGLMENVRIKSDIKNNEK
jgi:F-type H+-transporting ATPase subunit delta